MPVCEMFFVFVSKSSFSLLFMLLFDPQDRRHGRRSVCYMFFCFLLQKALSLCSCASHRSAGSTPRTPVRVLHVFCFLLQKALSLYSLLFTLYASLRSAGPTAFAKEFGNVTRGSTLGRMPVCQSTNPMNASQADAIGSNSSGTSYLGW